MGAERVRGVGCASCLAAAWHTATAPSSLPTHPLPSPPPACATPCLRHPQVGAPWADGSATTGARIFGRDADFAEHFLNSDAPGGTSLPQPGSQAARQSAAQPHTRTRVGPL